MRALSRTAVIALMSLSLSEGNAPGASLLAQQPPASCSRSSGLLLPEGFCAVAVAESLGRIRQLTVLPNGDVITASRFVWP